MEDFIRRHWFPALLAAVIFGPGVWWSMDTTPPIKITASTIERNEVPRGGSLAIAYTIERSRLCRGVAQRVFVDAKETLIPIEAYAFNERYGRNGKPFEVGTETNRVSIPVPFAAAPGPAKYQAVIEYFCNPLQRLIGPGIVVLTPVETFKVTREQVSEVTPSTKLPGAIPTPPAAALRRFTPPFPEEPPLTGSIR